MPNAAVKIAIGIKSEHRNFAERFTPTVTMNETLHHITDLESYTTTVPAFVDAVWAYILQERARGQGIALHYGITISNVTHPTPAAGLIPMPKRHHDSALTDLQLTSDSVIEEALLESIRDLRSAAKY